MRRSESAFSLLEVMAAVAVVAIVFTTLARVASQGLYSEGLSKRRMEASLLADDAVANFEMSAVSGEAPSPGVTEFEEGLYLVTVEVNPFDVIGALPEPDLPTDVELPGRSDGNESEDIPNATIHAIKVTVSWPEGFEQGSVSRLTYAVDLSEFESEAPTLAPPTSPDETPGEPS